MSGRSVAALFVRRGGAAVAGGVLLYAGHPPLDQPWAGYVAVVPLLLLARTVRDSRHPLQKGFAWGLVAGLIFFLPLLTWLARFGLAAWVLSSLLEALFVAAFVLLLVFWGERPWRGAFAVVAWVGLEWLRSNIPFGGFTWGVLGATQHDGGPVLPVAGVLGVLGVSAVLATVAVCLEALGVRLWRREGLRALVAPVAVLLGLALALLLVPGAPAPTSETVDIAAVQGNDVELPAFVDRTNSTRIADIADRMVVATSRLRDDPGGAPDVVVWPENALDSDPRVEDGLRARVVEAQSAIGGATLLAGTLLDGERPRTFRNTIVRYGPGGEVAEVYDKRILVPFGEYVPFRTLLGGLPPLQAIPSDGVPGDAPHVFDIDGVKVGPITCFESIFAPLVRDQVRAGAQVLVVSTNNASFGRSPASRQHLAFSQVRAVETGRWVMHAGISGISAVVSPDAEVTQQTELFQQAIVRADLPLVDEPTVYVRAGDVIGPVTAVLLALLLGLRLLSKRRPEQDSMGSTAK